jgi:UDP-glucose 4-epimerase
MISSEKKVVVITGGAGYIGSAVSLFMLSHGYKVIIIDKSLPIGVLAQEAYKADNLIYIQSDFANEVILHQLFSHYKIEAVMHFAALIEVAESIEFPHLYYENNVVKTIKLLDIMRTYSVKNFIFSSSCAVYGTPASTPINESCEKKPISPYGKTKLMIELILEDYALSYNINSMTLRYFNASGAWLEYDLGEMHSPETHLIPSLLKAATTKKPFIIFGNNYNTIDGTCVRDYLHIKDLASAHYLALQYLNHYHGYNAFNLGSGKGTSILELVKAVEKATHTTVNLKFGPRRTGDPAILIADFNKAKTLLGWQPKYSNIENIVSTANLFHNNINNFPSKSITFSNILTQ